MRAGRLLHCHWPSGEPVGGVPQAPVSPPPPSQGGREVLGYPPIYPEVAQERSERQMSGWACRQAANFAPLSLTASVWSAHFGRLPAGAGTTGSHWFQATSILPTPQELVRVWAAGPRYTSSSCCLPQQPEALTFFCYQMLPGVYVKKMLVCSNHAFPVISV